MKITSIRTLPLLIALMIAPRATQAAPSPAERANVSRVQVEVIEASLQNNDVIIGLNISASGLDIHTLHSLMVEPVLRGSERELAMPSVVYSGTQRYMFDKRAQKINPAEGLIRPYRVFTNISPRRSYAVDYSIRVPFQLWMGSASLSVFYRLHDCCDELMVSEELLIGNLGIDPCPPGMRLAEGIPMEASIPDLVYIPEVESAPAPAPAITEYDPNAYGAFDEEAQWAGIEYIPAPAPVAWQPDMRLITPMVLFIAPQVEQVKKRQQIYTAYLNFRQGSSVIDAAYKNNTEELARIHELVVSINDDPSASLASLHIAGFASPEGAYYDNIALSKRRANALKEHIQALWQMPESRFSAEGFGEDWATLETMVEHSDMADKQQVLDIIRTVDVFAGREATLMDINGGRTYKQMLAEMFPRLRRMELTADYVVEHLEEDELEPMMQRNPERMSLEELHRTAQRYPIGSQEFADIYETAASLFPDDVVANNNAAAVALMRGDIQMARSLLNIIKQDSRSFVNQGVLAYIVEGPEAARQWFERAAAAGFEAGANNIRTIGSEGYIQ